MKNGLFKICSMILVIVLLVNMLPLQVMAEQFNISNIESSKIDPIPVEDDISADKIISEIPHKRTEFSKEFLLENGLHMITVYPEAVHYPTQNGWEEIDNTLITKSDGSITNTAGVWDVSFPQQLSKEQGITIQKDGYTLSFFMAGELTNATTVKTDTLTRQASAETFSAESVKNSVATIQKPNLEIMRQSVKHEQMVVEKNYSKIAYANVYKNTDLVYDLASNRVKESVILESYSSALRGYRYTLDVGTMVPVLEEDGQIVFYNANQEEIVMVMPAPYLADNANAYNHDIQVQLTGSGSHYTMTYLLPQQWLAEEDRVWPVVLDPVVQPALTTSNIRDRTVAEYDTFNYDWGMNACGYSASMGKVWCFLMYDNLPDLTSSDVVINATVQMYKEAGSSDVTPVYTHKVFDTWTSTKITWIDKPGIAGNIEDYALVSTDGYYTWDITDVVRGWYAGQNTGIVFKTSNEIENTGTPSYKEFYSSDYDQNNLPILTITFRNNNGLESYWDYTASSAGASGTGYVNNYTGNLVWVSEDIGYDGNRMPVSINRIYNANDAYIVNDNNNANNSSGNAFGLGNGWRTNYNQLVEQWDINSAYYIWEDADGTDHYFKRVSDNVYEDEDGLDLTLRTIPVEGDKVEKTITDKKGNTSYFDTKGRLYRIENNQQTKSSINITYSGNTKYISTITDGVGRKYNFNYFYGASVQLYEITFTGNGTIPTNGIYYAYENDNLKYVSSNDKTTVYTYGTNNLLTGVYDDVGNQLQSHENTYILSYSYNVLASRKPARVSAVAASENGKSSGVLLFDYAHNQTTITDQKGNTQIMQFNNMGNTICIQDDEGRAQYSQFARNDAKEETTEKANQLKLSSKLQNTVVNLLNDSSFEGGNIWYSNNSQTSASLNSSESYHGNRSMYIVTTQANNIVNEQGYPVGAGETITFAAYVKTGSATAYISVSGYGESERLAPNSDWTRLESTYTNNTNGMVYISPTICAETPGSLWVDCAQLEYASTASRYNLVENSDFRYGYSGWSANTGLVLDNRAIPQLDTCVFAITGSPTAAQQLSQTVKVNGGEGDSFVLTGWAKGNSAPLWKEEEGNNSREFALRLHFNYADGTTSESFTAQCNPDSDQWQYVTVAAVAQQAYTSITVEAIYNYNVNTVKFDGIQLFKEAFGTSYTYDKNGNVISVIDLQKQTTAYEYDTNSNLTKIIQNNKAKMTYTYDEWNNILTATSEDGQVYNFTYDTYGNNLSVTTTTDDGTMTTAATYSPDGNRLVSTTDTLGNITTYSYNATNNVLEWVQYPETRTSYTYDERHRVTSVSVGGSIGQVTYQYNSNGQPTRISTNTTPYNFTYGNFGLVTGITAGSHTLATYQYTQDGKNNLSTLDYGNGHCVEYSYDDKGRVIEEAYNSGSVSYTYNNNGDLATVTDSHFGLTTTYYYDLVDRMVKYRETGDGQDHIVAYSYDNKNNLSSVEEKLNDVTRTTDYTYDDYNRVESVSNGAASENYNYDSLGRANEIITKNGNTNVLTESYTFTAPSANATSGQIATNRLQAAGYDVTYSYTYDGNGNILSISDGTNTTSYVYDSANQLIRENNQAAGLTWTWEYDYAGNIRLYKEYAYTTGTLDMFQTLKNYNYAHEEWGDLLTIRHGKNMTNDAIGNPLSDGTWYYCWTQGRELLEMYNYDTGWRFTYNADGMRLTRRGPGITYAYDYTGSALSRMTAGDDTLYFAYGANGLPMTVTYNGITYYYVTNIQGDVIAILDEAGNPVVNYTYDAWGKPLSRTGSMADTLGIRNPLRYRSYVYDQETGLYYLQSRYYNPETGRFINADGVMSGVGGDIKGYNLFAYCMNNPVNMSDSSGNWPKWIKSAVNAVKTGAMKIAASVKSTLSKVDFKEAINKGKQIAKVAYTNVEISAGLGLGLYGEANIGDVVGLGFGISYNLIEVKFDDGKLVFQQSYNEGLSASVLFVDVLQDASESGSRKLTLSSPMGDFIPDDYNSNWTITSAAAYLVAGGSVYVGFDMISFCQEIENIFFYPD